MSKKNPPLLRSSGARGLSPAKLRRLEEDADGHLAGHLNEGASRPKISNEALTRSCSDPCVVGAVRQALAEHGHPSERPVAEPSAGEGEFQRTLPPESLPFDVCPRAKRSNMVTVSQASEAEASPSRLPCLGGGVRSDDVGRRGEPTEAAPMSRFVTRRSGALPDS